MSKSDLDHPYYLHPDLRMLFGILLRRVEELRREIIRSEHDLLKILDTLADEATTKEGKIDPYWMKEKFKGEDYMK